MRIVILIITTLTILLGLTMAFAGPLSQLGLFDWRMAFRIMQSGAQPLMIGAGLSALSLIIGVVRKLRGTVVPSLLGIVVPAIVLAILGGMRSDGGAHPIHDITTDIDNPPVIVAAANFDRSNPPTYEAVELYGRTGKTVPQLQRELYPDLAAQTFPKSPALVFDAAMQIVNSSGWNVLTSDKEKGVIEAVHKSLWFGFQDDVVIRISAATSGSRVDIRSKSRVGRSDLGANINRIRTFQTKLEKALQ